MTRCDHDPMACCWRCSDRVPWWRAARIKAGLGERPPNTFLLDYERERIEQELLKAMKP